MRFSCCSVDSRAAAFRLMIEFPSPEYDDDLRSEFGKSRRTRRDDRIGARTASSAAVPRYAAFAPRLPPAGPNAGEHTTAQVGSTFARDRPAVLVAAEESVTRSWKSRLAILLVERVSLSRTTPP
jgi:hypothetical protein